MIATLLAALTLGVWLAATRELVVGSRLIGRIEDVDPATLPAPAPRLTIVIAARDEERHIATALASVLALDYPALEVVAVDDRSTDRTGVLLDAAAAVDPRLRVVHVSALPAGWLGKNHALELGAGAARGDWLLFTDADVHLAPDLLRRAVAHAERAGLDHLVLGPRITGGSPLMRLQLTFFGLSFALSTRPWRARDPARSEHIGVGAFNLLRRRAFDAIGGFSRIPLRPDDDIKLGKLVKAAGLRQDFMPGGDLLTVEWYRSVGEMVRGLEKNSFPFLEYSVPATLAAVGALFLLTLWPLVGLGVGLLGGAPGVATWLDVATVLLILGLSAGTALRMLRASPWLALGYPFGALMMMVTILNSMLRTLLQGGVVWRGTLYPLAALRANRV